MAHLLECLINLSEKAANLARIIRSEHALFELLVQRKDNVQKNDDSFVEDFKTLGDVLIQEMIRHEIEAEFSDLAERVLGEETNKFTNTLGETITVTIQPTASETADLLNRVLNGNTEAATLLAEALHKEVACEVGSKVKDLPLELDWHRLGIWIDPIDGTSEFIKGNADVAPVDGIYPNGLQCALVLIGVFDRVTGEPVMGVVNQPFAEFKDGRWQGRFLWGVSHNGVTASSFTCVSNSHESINFITSWSEQEVYTSRLRRIGNLKSSSGAGYKILCAIEGFVDGYFVSSGNTYKWDTCAPHALLRSIGGGIVDYEATLKKFLEGQDIAVAAQELVYHKPDDGISDAKAQWSNSGGLVAYTDHGSLQRIFTAFS